MVSHEDGKGIQEVSEQNEHRRRPAVLSPLAKTSKPMSSLDSQSQSTDVIEQGSNHATDFWSDGKASPNLEEKPAAELSSQRGEEGNGTIPALMRVQSHGSLHSRSSHRSTSSKFSSSLSALSQKRRRQREYQAHVWPDPHKYNPRSLYMFTLDNKFRRLLIRGIEWKWWDRTVLFLIFLNTIQLALYEPFDNATLRPGFHKRDVLDICGKVFSVFFTLECIAKVMALGFIVGHHTYLSDGWNYLDFFIVIVGLLDFMPMNSAGNLSALRSLRVLRPLRAITKFPELKFLVVLLLQCIPNLSNVFGICLFIFFVFGILGVQLFAVNSVLVEDRTCSHPTSPGSAQRAMLRHRIRHGRRRHLLW
eukprot:751196-Hanusia_phi.AAC.1